MTGLPFVVDDGGRAAAGFTGVRDTGDCVVRAIAIATGIRYRDVYDALADGMAKLGKPRSARNGVNRKVYETFLLARGFTWHPTMQIGTGCTVHLREGELPPGPPLVVRLSRHLCAVVDGAVRDTHDPRRDGTRCVYGYYRASC